MKPINFPEQNATYAEDQPEYRKLPAFREPDGKATSCWGLSWRERLQVLLTGRVWLTVLTFNQPLQPMALRVGYPFVREDPTDATG